MFVQEGRGSDFGSMKARWVANHPQSGLKDKKIENLEKENKRLKEELAKMKGEK